MRPTLHLVDAARDYEDMHHLVDRLSLAQVRRLRLLVTQDEELSQVVEPLSDAPRLDEKTVPEGLFALIGCFDSGRGDVAERHDDYIRERLRRRYPRSA